MKTLKENVKTIRTYQMADAIRLSRFRGKDSIYAYILNAYSNVSGVTDEKVEKAYEEYPDLAAHRYFVCAISSGDLRGAETLLRENDIDINSLTAYYGKFDKGLWAAVALRSPVMRFIKYLAKFAREGVLTDNLLKTKVTVDSLKKAKVFPFRLYAAYQYLTSANQLTNCSVNETVDFQYLLRVIDEYVTTYDWSMFIDAKWVLAPDVSGSMNSVIGRSSTLRYADISAMFVGFFMKGLKNVKVLPWDTSVHDYPMLLLLVERTFLSLRLGSSSSFVICLNFAAWGLRFLRKLSSVDSIRLQGALLSLR